MCACFVLTHILGDHGLEKHDLFVRFRNRLRRLSRPTPLAVASSCLVTSFLSDPFEKTRIISNEQMCTSMYVFHVWRQHPSDLYGPTSLEYLDPPESGKGENKLGKLLEKVRADALAGKDTDVWCSMRFQLAAPLDVGVEFAVTKAGKVVAEPSFEGKPVVRMGERDTKMGQAGRGGLPYSF